MIRHQEHQEEWARGLILEKPRRNPQELMGIGSRITVRNADVISQK